ncbi:MAG: leucyl/phenylalanyl-tRNA--protein transferase [Bacteroidetes bacterium]|nr:leucyl/phenylalanyl-tRNA--protein transferase [Bacteroidota bacterium]
MAKNVHEQQREDNIIEPALLLTAYCTGLFPMADGKEGPIRWYSPDPRGIIELNEFRVSRSLRQVLKKNIFEIRYNTAFEKVIRCCADRTETWISETIVNSYIELHKRGYAHSVESWIGDSFAGGLYGVAIGGAFFGESMCSKVSNASKVALVYLVNRLRERGYLLLDVQFLNPHLIQFGARTIPRSDYVERLQKAINKSCSFI